MRQTVGTRERAAGAQAYLISERPPGTRQVWTARVIVASQLAAFLLTLPFGSMQFARQDAFVPIANTIVCLNDLITASLLYAQVRVTRNRGLVPLASGYLFAALILIPHQLAFPGAFAPNGLLGAHLQSSAWLYIFHHVGFLAGTLLYATADPSRNGRRAPASILRSVGVVIAAVLFLTWLATAEADLLPSLMRDTMYPTSPFDPVVSPLLLLLCLTTVVVFRRPRASILALWLQVALSSWVFEVLLLAIMPSRFSLVFYVGRTMGILCSSFVLLALLTEAMVLHTRLALSTAAREHEREAKRAAMEAVVGSIAHEVRQPLTAIKANADAGGYMLSSSRPQLDEIRETFDDIGKSALRASEVIDSARSLFAASPNDLRAIDVNDLVREAVAMMRFDLERHGVGVHLDLSSALPPIQGHRGQLMEVVVNGVTNAVDSVAAVADRPRELTIRTARENPDSVLVSIADNGEGIDPLLKPRTFEPFHTTKRGGMGLGLSICQSIVEAHGGTLSLLPRPAHGAVFRVDLPVRAVSSRGSGIDCGGTVARL